jgi:hypothetical protein
MGAVDVVIARVVCVCIKEEALMEVLVDLKKVLPTARCGHNKYTVVRETFKMVSPGGGNVLYGLEGSAEANVNGKEEIINGTGKKLS